MQRLTKNMSFMQWLLKRRRIITIALILCICFLIYQLLSLKQLTVSIDMESKTYYKTVAHVRQHQFNDNKLYKCFISLEQIPYSYVNDDYCDCLDGTDEPLTNACNTNKFYCANKSKTRENSIPSNRVNDGICDCCDGSDEMLNISLPLILSTTQWETMKSSHMRVRYTPCSNHCEN